MKSFLVYLASARDLALVLKFGATGLVNDSILRKACGSLWSDCSRSFSTFSVLWDWLIICEAELLTSLGVSKNSELWARPLCFETSSDAFDESAVAVSALLWSMSYFYQNLWLNGEVYFLALYCYLLTLKRGIRSWLILSKLLYWFFNIRLPLGNLLPRTLVL